MDFCSQCHPVRGQAEARGLGRPCRPLQEALEKKADEPVKPKAKDAKAPKPEPVAVAAEAAPEAETTES